MQTEQAPIPDSQDPGFGAAPVASDPVAASDASPAGAAPPIPEEIIKTI